MRQTVLSMNDCAFVGSYLIIIPMQEVGGQRRER